MMREMQDRLLATVLYLKDFPEMGHQSHIV